MKKLMSILFAVVSLQANAAYLLKLECKGVSQLDAKKKVSLSVAGLVGSFPGMTNSPFTANVTFKGKSSLFGSYPKLSYEAEATKTILSDSKLYVIPMIQLNRSINMSVSIEADGETTQGTLTLINGLRQESEDFDLTCK